MIDKYVLTMILVDGTSTGIIEASLDDWYGICYKIPRNKIKEASLLDCISNSGVYILLGDDEETGGKKAYIGESENAYKEVINYNKSKDFWNEALVFVSNDNTLNKAHIKYVEHELYQKAKKCNRFIIENATNPTKSSLSTADGIKADKFIDKVQLITSTLGYRIFDMLITDNNEDDKLYLKVAGDVVAEAKVTDEGFVILKGSKIVNEIKSSLSKGLVNYVNKERASNDIKDNIFINDHLVSSPSMGAVIILGRNANGRTEWRNKNGKTLKEIQENFN